MKSSQTIPRYIGIVAHISKGKTIEQALEAFGQPLPSLPNSEFIIHGNLFGDIECDDVEYTLTSQDGVRLTRSLESPVYQMPSGLTREQKRELISAAANAKLENEM